MSSPTPAVVPATHTRVVHSELADADYLISIAEPFHYDETSDRVWPVIYVLDGNWHFNLVVEMVRFMNIRIGFCNELPDAFVVGIGYPVDGTLIEMLHQVMHLRMRDFVLGREEGGEEFMMEHFPIDEPIPSGNGPGFMRFIRHELIPMVEQSYRADPDDRTLLGHSLGANFAIYTLFDQPRTFQRAVIASSDPLLDHEEAFAATGEPLPVRMHLTWESSAEQESSSSQLLSDRLRSRNYPGLALTQESMPTTHCAMVPYAYQSGLVQVFGTKENWSSTS